MLKKKTDKKLDKRTAPTKVVRFQNQAKREFQIAWLNPKHALCKTISSQHYCFCGHFLSEHLCREQTINKCTADRCKCVAFCFVPDLNLKCICKHAPFRHNFGTKKCQQCATCIGFLSEWLCQCGYRYEEHMTDVKIQREVHALLKQNNGSVVSCRKKMKSGDSSLPRLNNTVNVRYARADKVKESMSASLVKLKVINSGDHYQASEQSHHESYLKEKLKQANLRFFSKFTELRVRRQQKEEGKQEPHQANGLDLYIQPHFFRNCSLAKHISVLTTNRS